MFEHHRRWIYLLIAFSLQLAGLALPGLATEPVWLSRDLTRPKLIHKVEPRYTEIARRARIQGRVIAEAVIDEKGRVTDVRILRSLPMGLDQKAEEAIRQWRFKPARQEGKPVKVYYTLVVTFRIKG